MSASSVDALAFVVFVSAALLYVGLFLLSRELRRIAEAIEDATRTDEVTR